MKKLIEYLAIIGLMLVCVWVFTLQRSEITALHIQLDTLKAGIGKMFVADTIKVYVIKGVIERKGK